MSKTSPVLDKNGQLNGLYFDDTTKEYFIYTDGVPIKVASGQVGPQGPAGTITVGTVTAVEQDKADVRNVGTPENAILDFDVPKGDIGPQGEKGDRSTIQIGNVTQSAAPNVINVGDEHDAIFDFELVKGEKGDKGEDAIAAIIPKGNWEKDIIYAQSDYVTADDGNAYVCIKNHFSADDNEPPNQEFWQLIALRGAPGKAATINVGNTTLGKIPKVTNVGDEHDAILDFEIPAVEISKEPDNIITEKADGLYASADKIKLDPDITNALENRQDGLYVKDLQSEIDELKLFKFPNATIYGQPTINNGQISNFSTNNYLAFPFIVDMANRPFVIDIDISTGGNVTSQRNILDSEFGMAFAIKDGHFVLAVSNDGTSWTFAENGTHDVQINTNYLIRISWDKNTYKLQYSINDGLDYIDDISVNNNVQPFPKRIIIGKSIDNRYVFDNGIINFNHCYVTISDKVIWQGMDDAGLATRADISLSNIDKDGEQRIKDLVGIYQKQEEYLTEEKIVGCNDIGKPIYRKAIEITRDYVNGEYIPVPGVNDIEDIFNYGGVAYYGTGATRYKRNFPWISPNYVCSLNAWSNNSIMYYSQNGEYIRTGSKIWIEYTKTSDLPNSYKPIKPVATVNAVVGTIFPFATDNIPTDFLECDGKEYLINFYRALFDVIGNKYGGDGVNTFKVPDLRESVLVGAGQNTTYNISAHDVYTVGQFKDDQFQGHYHNIDDKAIAQGDGQSRGALGTPPLGSNNTMVKQPVNDGVNGDPRYGTTTHGKQTGVIYAIKCRADSGDVTLDPDGGLELTDKGLAISDDFKEYIRKRTTLDYSKTLIISGSTWTATDRGQCVCRTGAGTRSSVSVNGAVVFQFSTGGTFITSTTIQVEKGDVVSMSATVPEIIFTPFMA